MSSSGAVRVWPRPRLRERWRFVIVLGLLVALIGAEIVFAYATTLGNKAADDAVERTEAILKQTNQASAAVSDMEIGYRGFLLTRDGAFLESYTSARATYRDLLQKLEQQTARNPSQVARWQAILQLANDWEASVAEPGIESRRGVLDEQPGAGATALGDRTRLQQIRTLFGEAILLEESLLAQRRRAQAQADSSLLFVLVWGTSAAVVLSLGLGAWILKHLEAERLRGVWLAIQTSEHELYNRLTMARGNLELLLREQGLSERQQRWAERAHFGVLSAGEAVARMRDLPHLRETRWSPESRVTTLKLPD